MRDSPLTESELAALRAFDTPTICNALEVVAPDRRGYGFTVEPLFCAFPELPPMVGYARTCSVRAMRPTALAKDAAARQRLDYYAYVAEGPGPTISVVQDVDSRRGFGAFWGEVNTNIHRGLGCIGTVTDGSIRDLDAIAEGFQMLAGSVGPSHAWIHLEDFGGVANVHGMTVASGDLVHADRHGAVVIPHEVARQVPDAAELLGRREAVILEAAKAPGFDIDALRKAMGDAEEIH